MAESEIRDRAEQILARVGVVSEHHVNWMARAVPILRAELSTIDIAKIADALTDVGGAHPETVEKGIVLGIALAMASEGGA